MRQFLQNAFFLIAFVSLWTTIDGAEGDKEKQQNDLLKKIVDFSIANSSLGKADVDISNFGLSPEGPDGLTVVTSPITLSGCSLYDLDSVEPVGDIKLENADSSRTISGQLKTEALYMLCRVQFNYRKSSVHSNKTWDEVERADIQILLSSPAGATINFAIFHSKVTNAVVVKSLTIDAQWTAKIFCPLGLKNVCKYIREKVPTELPEYFNEWAANYLEGVFEAVVVPQPGKAPVGSRGPAAEAAATVEPGVTTDRPGSTTEQSKVDESDNEPKRDRVKEYTKNSGDQTKSLIGKQKALEGSRVKDSPISGKARPGEALKPSGRRQKSRRRDEDDDDQDNEGDEEDERRRTYSQLAKMVREKRKKEKKKGSSKKPADR